MLYLLSFTETATIQKAKHIEIEVLKKLEKIKCHRINEHSGYFAGLFLQTTSQ